MCVQTDWHLLLQQHRIPDPFQSCLAPGFALSHAAGEHTQPGHPQPEQLNCELHFERAKVFLYCISSLHTQRDC